MGCWCKELDGYTCIDCERESVNVPYHERKALATYGMALANGAPKSEWEILFWKTEAIREKLDSDNTTRKAEVEKRKSEIIKNNPDILFNELYKQLTGVTR